MMQKEPMSDTLTNDIFSSSEEEEVTNVFGEDTPPEKPYQEEEGDGRPPDRYAARTSGEDIISGAVVLVGTSLVNRRIDPPVGRCLQLEAPIAGRKIDEFIANTWVDKMLQPLFRKSDQLEGIGAIVGLPVLVAVLERKPELTPVLGGAVFEVLSSVLGDLGKYNRKKRSERRRAFTRQQLADLMGIPVDEIPRNQEPAEFLINSFIFQEEPVAAEG